MPKAWTEKDERMYEHVKESELERGRAEEKAEEIAARTVNKHRREEGRTESGKVRTEGTGNPTTRLDERTRDEVYNRAKELGVEGRSDMTKDELVDAVREKE